MYIYIIKNKINDKVYIGQTKETLEKRFKRHTGYQRREHDTKFYRALNKNNIENFYIELLEECKTQEELDAREIFYINFYDSIKKGYNTNLGGFSSGGDTLSQNENLEKIRIKISNSKKLEKNPNATKVKAINLITGEKNHFNSVKECQIYYNIPRHDIVIRRCNGKIKKPYKIYLTFEYIL